MEIVFNILYNPHSLISLMNMRIQEANKIISEVSKSISNIKFDKSFSDAVDAILNCKGKIIISAMGKGGIAVKKFSATLCSIGIPSCYLHPGEALHGDLGMLDKKDVLFVASTSGKTREVLEIIDLARNIKVKKIIGITSHIDSPVRKKVDILIDMGPIKEAGYLNIVPTSSILVIMAICDCLAMVVAKESGFSLKKYSKFHHGGYLGAIARGDDKIY